MTGTSVVPRRYTSAEQKFAAAFADASAQKPKWLLRIEPASSFYDVHGVDFVAVIQYSKGEASARVPVQIKGSLWKKREYLRSHPAAVAAKVIVLVVTKEDTLAAVRQKFFGPMADVLTARRDYEPFFQYLEEKPLDERGEWIRHTIELRRQQEALPAPALPQTGQQNSLTSFQELLSQLAAKFSPTL